MLERLLGEGRLLSGVEALQKRARRLAQDPDLLAAVSYELGSVQWARLGNGDAARREFNAAVAVFDLDGREKISEEVSGVLRTPWRTPCSAPSRSPNSKGLPQERKS